MHIGLIYFDFNLFIISAIREKISCFIKIICLELDIGNSLNKCCG